MTLDKKSTVVSIKKSRHHVITRKFVRDHKLRLKRGYKKPIPHNIHMAYHTVFGSVCSWSVVKILKKWSKQIKQKEQPYFYQSFTPKQRQAFQLLFGFQPLELGNGQLTRAIKFIQDSGYFHPTMESMRDFKRNFRHK